MATTNSTAQLSLWSEKESYLCSRCEEWKGPLAFSARRLPGGGRSPRAYCKSCDTKKSKQWRDDNPEQAKQQDHAGHLRRSFGLTFAEYEMMVANHGGKCAICGTDRPGGRWNVLQVDHCHATNAIRGLLCRPCNSMLGYIRDNPETLRRAADYLEKHRELFALGKSRIAEKKLVVFSNKTLCKHPDCKRYVLAKGLCGRHYQRIQSEKRQKKRAAAAKQRDFKSA